MLENKENADSVLVPRVNPGCLRRSPSIRRIKLCGLRRSSAHAPFHAVPIDGQSDRWKILAQCRIVFVRFFVFCCQGACEASGSWNSLPCGRIRWRCHAAETLVSAGGCGKYKKQQAPDAFFASKDLLKSVGCDIIPSES